jgi:hypothetical protein
MLRKMLSNEDPATEAMQRILRYNLNSLQCNYKLAPFTFFAFNFNAASMFFSDNVVS